MSKQILLSSIGILGALVSCAGNQLHNETEKPTPAKLLGLSGYQPKETETLRVDHFAVRGTGLEVGQIKTYGYEGVETFVEGLKTYQIGREKEDFHNYMGGYATVFYFGNHSVEFHDDYLMVPNGEKGLTDYYYTGGWPMPIAGLLESYRGLHIESDSAYVQETNKTDGVLEGLLAVHVSGTSFEGDPGEKLLTVRTGRGGRMGINIYSDGVFEFDFDIGQFYQLTDGYNFDFLF